MAALSTNVVRHNARAQSLGWNDSLPNAGGIAQQLLALSYSRRADAAGEAFLTKASLRADGLGRLFAHEETIEGHGGEIPFC